MAAPQSSKPHLHYAWVIVAAGMLTVFACLGFGRFALGMLLPSMAATLHLSYSQIGFIGTANFAGYLAAVLVCGPLAARIGSRRLIVASLALIALSMAFVSRAAAYSSVLALYTLTGMGSGAANVPVMGLITAWFDRTIRGRAAGFVVIGSGFAIILSGALIPRINAAQGAEGWRTSWLLLAGGTALVALIAGVLLRDSPAEKGLQPLGAGDRSAPSSAPGPAVLPARRSGPLALLGVLYFLFGYTYVIYATFFVTTLVKERGFSEAAAGNLWSWVGLLSLASGPVFGTLSDRIGRKAGLMIVFSLQALAYGLTAAHLPPVFLAASIALYGICAWSIPSIMVAAVAEYAGAERALAAFGFITFIFGIGQIAGPAAAGVLAEATGSFSSSFTMAAIMAAAAAALAGLLKPPLRN